MRYTVLRGQPEVANFENALWASQGLFFKDLDVFAQLLYAIFKILPPPFTL